MQIGLVVKIELDTFESYKDENVSIRIVLLYANGIL